MKRILLVFLAACGPGAGAQTLTDLCPSTGGPAAPKALVTGKKMRDLALGSNALVYVDRDGGPGTGAQGKPGAVWRVALDGTGDTKLYEPATDAKFVIDVTVKNDVV